LERESQRNVELMWLTERLTPDFKTIANFRKDNGRGIREVCKQFVTVCRKLNLLSQSTVVIDGSKFKGVNNRDRNVTPGKIKRRREELERRIDRYFYRLDKMDQKSEEVVAIQTPMLKEKIASLKEALAELDALEPELDKREDKQISLTDPEARSLRTRGTEIVGYNVQTAVEPDNHLIVAHEVTNQFNDRNQLSPMAIAAREAMGVDTLDAVADRGYFKGEQVLACDEAGITAYVPHTTTSNNKAKGLYDKADFRYVVEDDEYQCPAGERLKRRSTREEYGKQITRYWTSNCGQCALKPKCTTGKERRVSRWEREDVLEAMRNRLDRHPETMRMRRDTVEHPFGTLKRWMGAENFLMKGLVALWREGLLAQKVLKGDTKGYKNHPQLIRFKALSNPISAIRRYLYYVHWEALARAYNFDRAKIGISRSKARIDVSIRQIAYEVRHLLLKLESRDPGRHAKYIAIEQFETHPMFDVFDGEVADWEVR